MSGQAEQPIPASLAAAWGLAGRPGRGPKPGLSVAQIADAGVRVAATEGLAAVSMARVARELGASTMALYRYVAAKEELLVLMVDTALGPPAPPEPHEQWRAALSRWSWDYHQRLTAHPWAVRVP
ncbi:MAG: TetR/AcrR family transcriptional regulator, partial [Solirubrobacterales bacterium]|nr:TetR/AcrR family transcriptional regulator [Solirubrobacterales bacterium]